MVNMLEMEIDMKNDNFVPEYFALNKLIIQRKLEMNEALFEMSDPDVTEDKKKELQAKVNRLACSIGCNEMMMRLGEKYETNF